jgi:hypothetical protein
MTTPNPGETVNDKVVSIIRTVVPGAWAALLTWAVTQVPALEPVLNQPAALGVGSVLVTALLTLWYTVMRSLEQHMPPWLTRLVLGANSRPVYVDPNAAPAGPVASGELRIPRTAEDG